MAYKLIAFFICNDINWDRIERELKSREKNMSYCVDCGLRWGDFHSNLLLCKIYRFILSLP